MMDDLVALKRELPWGSGPIAAGYIEEFLLFATLDIGATMNESVDMF
jgi:hypothetical protein